MHLPYADTSIRMEFVTEEYYDQIPERVSYKTYPFYMPGSEPEGYYDSLASIDPVVNFKEEDLKTEEDWIRAGELIYDMPMNFIPLDSAMLVLLPAIAARWKATGILPNKKGIIPFVAISIRKKGKPELGIESCGMCHTKQMPDDQLFKGAQGNFVADRFRNIMTTTHPNWQNASSETRLNRFYDFNKSLYYTPWVKNEYQENYKKIKPEDLLTTHYGLLPGVQTRNNASFDHPISIPDLYNLKEENTSIKAGITCNVIWKTLCVMPYSTQNMNMSSSYNGFIPDPVPAHPADYKEENSAILNCMPWQNFFIP